MNRHRLLPIGSGVSANDLPNLLKHAGLPSFCKLARAEE